MSKIDLETVRTALPMPALLAKLGYGDRCKRSALCPFHEDKNPSFSVYEVKGRHKFKCHAGCGQGDEVDFIKLAMKINDDGEAIRQYADWAGVLPTQEKALANETLDTPGKALRAISEIFTGVTLVSAAEQEKPADTQDNLIKVDFKAGRLEPLTDKDIIALCKFRGYSAELVSWLNKYGLIGRFDKCVAFQVTNGVHFKKAGDEGWRFSEGAKPDLFIVGHIEEGANIHVFESQWDALAFADRTKQRTNIVATRGAGNVKLLEQLRGHSGTLYLWPQNDMPGAGWANKIHDFLTDAQQLKLCRTPEKFKDFNDWHKANEPGMESDVGFAWTVNSENFPVPVLAEPSPPAEKLVATGEARESTNDEGMALEANIQLAPKSDSRGGETLLTAEIKTELDGAEAAHPPAFPEDDSSLSAPRKARKRPQPSADSQAEGQAPVRQSGAPLSETLDKIAEFLQRYVVFTDEDQAQILALWVAHSWCFQSFRFTPYLNVCSPEKRCGKTRLLECIQIIVPKPRSMVRPTEAVLFRTIEKEKPTLLLDEIDTIYTTEADDRSEGLRAVLNAGFQAGPFSTIPRCIGRNHEPEDFNTFCPKVIAGIGKNLPDTVRDRSIEVRLVRQTSDKRADKFRASDAESEAVAIREALDIWSREKGKELSEARPKMPEQLQDRQQDMMEPLVAIADMASKEWGSKAREALITIGATHEDQSTGVRLLACCRQVFHATSLNKITSAGLLGHLVKMETADAPWSAYWENDLKRGITHAPARRLAKLLEPYGIKPTTIRLEDEETAKGYYRSDFMDAWKRYLEPVKKEETAELPF